MTVRKPVLIASVVGIIVLGAMVALATKSNTSQPAECAAVHVTIDRGNSVHGLKEGKLFGYVDLALLAPELACHADNEIQNMIMGPLSAAVAEWWKEPRLQQASTGEIHIITILDKDEYAQANFNSAMTHGKVDFIRKDGQVEAQPVTLEFGNMRNAVEKSR